MAGVANDGIALIVSLGKAARPRPGKIRPKRLHCSRKRRMFSVDGIGVVGEIFDPSCQMNRLIDGQAQGVVCGDDADTRNRDKREADNDAVLLQKGNDASIPGTGWRGFDPGRICTGFNAHSCSSMPPGNQA